MAKKKLRGAIDGKAWVKGQSGNPAGRPPMPPKARSLRDTTRSDIMEAMCEVMAMARTDIDKMADKDEMSYASGARALMASVLSKGIAMGCPTRAQFFMTYLFGKPKEYDPKADETVPSYIAELEQVPSAAIMKAIHEVEKQRQAALIG